MTMSNFQITNGPSKTLFADPTTQFNTAGWVFNNTPVGAARRLVTPAMYAYEVGSPCDRNRSSIAKASVA